MPLINFRNLFTCCELKQLKEAPMYAGDRHPTWYPLFVNELQAIDYCLERAVILILQAGDKKWLYSQKSRLLDLEDPNNASASLAEIRVYGGLLEAGFSVDPIALDNRTPTPDFHIELYGERIEVEVAAKHQDEDQDKLQDAIYQAMREKKKKLPQGVEYCNYRMETTTVETVTAVYQPGGVPNPAKPNDSVQTNVISRVCRLREDEKQISGKLPSILAIDLTSFGGRHGADILWSKSKQYLPIISGHHGLTSGALWYAMYGWNGAPVFEEGSDRKVQMLHEGRFRLAENKKSKLSAVLIVLPSNVILFENPWPVHRLPDDTRFAFCRYPWFDLSSSICDWQDGTVLQQIKLQEDMIYALEQRRDELQTFCLA